jgi:GTP-binding protein HflX
MRKTTVVEEKSTRAFLVGIASQAGGEEKISSSELDSLGHEFSSLVDTLGLEIVSQEVIHVREKNARYGIGTGKAEELAQKAVSLEADCIIFDRDLTPSQQRNWEELAGMSVIDRQELIIQIFASRARTREAELQVNLAKLVYSLPRLQHKYIDLSRQRGGRYGTRGSGETRLETDRRLVEQRIHRLKDELEVVKRQRQVQRRQRERQGLPVCALVGYTNTGKSTILNALTNAGVLAEDKLFATLDSTSRRLELSAGVTVLLVDTVGFIRRLPHNLINAFRSTMEEASRADVLINVLDAASPDIETQFKTTLSVLQEIGAGEIPVITVLNKIDRLESKDNLEALLKLYPGSVPVSALNGTGFADLCARIISATEKIISKPDWANEQQET